MLNIPRKLLDGLQMITDINGFKFVCANANNKPEAHRYIFTDNTIDILIEFKPTKKK